MKYEKNRSLVFNLCKYFGGQKPSVDEHYKITPHKIAGKGAVGMHDILLVGTTVIIVSHQSWPSAIPGGELKRNSDWMIASLDASEFNMNISEMINDGLDGEWIPGNAMYVPLKGGLYPTSKDLSNQRRAAYALVMEEVKEARHVAA